MDNIIVWPLSVENEAIFDMQFHVIVVFCVLNLYLIEQPRCKKLKTWESQ